MRTAIRPVPSALRLAAAALLACTALPAAATSSSVEWSYGVPQVMALGVGNGDSTFNRPGTGCGNLSPTGTAVRYDTVTVTNVGPRAGVLDVRTQPIAGNGSAACPALQDTVLAVYSSFDPANPTANCLAFNDNVDGSTACSRISNIAVPRGGSVTVVVAAASNAAAFPYDLRFDGSVYGGQTVFTAAFEPVERFVGRGMPASGEFTVDSYPAPLAAGSRLDGDVAFETGLLEGRFALAPAQLQDIATGVGFITLRTQMWQNGRGTGQVAVNNTATLAANELYLRLQHATVNGSPVDIGGNCQFGPIQWTLAGNADANSVDLTQASYTIPPGATNACNGFGAQFNSIIAGSDNSVTISLER